MSPKTKTIGVVVLLMAGSFVAGFRTCNSMYMWGINEMLKLSKRDREQRQKRGTWERKISPIRKEGD